MVQKVFALRTTENKADTPKLLKNKYVAYPTEEWQIPGLVGNRDWEVILLRVQKAKTVGEECSMYATRAHIGKVSGISGL